MSGDGERYLSLPGGAEAHVSSFEELMRLVEWYDGDSPDPPGGWGRELDRD